MTRVAIIGAGQTPFDARPDATLKGLFAAAVEAAVDDVRRGFDPQEIEEAHIGSLATGGSQLGNFGPLMSESAGLTGAAAQRVENACASSGFAFRDAVMAVASGRVRFALAGGIEKMSDLPRARNRGWLGVSGDVEWERLAGTNFPGIYAMIARRHMYEHGTTRGQIAGVAVKNRSHAVANPKAQLRKPLGLEDALAAPMLADPLGFCDACGITDGASAVILCRWDDACALTDRPVEVVGSGAGSDVVALHDGRSAPASTPSAGPPDRPMRAPRSNRPTSTSPRSTTALPSPNCSPMRISASAARPRPAALSTGARRASAAGGRSMSRAA